MGVNFFMSKSAEIILYETWFHRSMYPRDSKPATEMFLIFDFGILKKKPIDLLPSHSTPKASEKPNLKPT